MALTVGERGHGGQGHPAPGPDGGGGVTLVAGPGQDPEVAGGAGRSGGDDPGDHRDVHDEEQLPVHHGGHLVPRTPASQVILPARHQAVRALETEC